jgi:hypothetical protein
MTHKIIPNILKEETKSKFMKRGDKNNIFRKVIT